MANSQFKLPWVFGVKRPNFVFYRIKLAIPTTVPTSLIYLVIFLSVFYIFMGGVYDLVTDDIIAFGQDEAGNPVLYYPSQDRQFLIEGVVAALVMFMGAGGLYMMREATREPHNINRAYSYQLLGAFITVLALFILQSMFRCKVEPSTCA